MKLLVSKNKIGLQFAILAYLFFFSTHSQAVILYSPNGHLATDLEMLVLNFTSRDEDGYMGSPANGATLTTLVDYEKIGTTPTSQTAFGEALLTAQYGRIAGVSNWFGIQPIPQFGLAGVASNIISSAAFTIPDITISYRGVDAAPSGVNASLHVTTDIVGWGNHVVDILADFTGDLAGYLQSKRVVNQIGLNGSEINIADQVTEFGNYVLPVDQLFDLHLAVNVQSISRIYPNLIDEVGIKHRGWANWSIELGGSPAFILPEGYYANSADGSIVDNYFVGANTSVINATSPAHLWLMLGGLGLCFLKNRKRVI